MLFNNSPGRLSTRWKVADHTMTSFRLLFITGLFSLLLTACKDKQAAPSQLADKTTTDSIAKPKVDIKVNRHYDEKGNVIGFDSTYSSYYSSINNDTLKMDSAFRDFDRYFRTQHQALFNKGFNDVFFNDSLGYPDFFHKDFFSQRYLLNDRYFRQMMTQMDSVKNKYYHDHPRR